MTMAGHRFHATVLREYDVRGIVGETLAEADAEALGKAFGSHARAKGSRTVAVGYDGRLSSPMLEAALVRGLTGVGIDVVRIGRGPTPMLYFATYYLGTAGGIMVTGSHNPPSHNGFKMMLQGKPFFGADIRALGTRAAAGDFATGAGEARTVEIEANYVARLLQDYDGARSLKVAWDAGNGATGQVLQQLTDKLPGRHLLLNEKIDGTFPVHHPDPTVVENLAQLQAQVTREGCDLGIAFDGDGDRIGVVDGKARIIWGDQLLALLARDVLAATPGATIIADVKASQVLFDEIARLGGRPLIYKTGHSLIKSKMAEERSPLAGEMSGHIFFADRYYGYDDALYAAVRLLGLLGRGRDSLADLYDSLPKVVNTPEIRFDCPDDRKFGVVEEVKARLEKAGSDLLAIDGVRVTTPDGWWLLRASNTQAVLVARCEAATPAALDRVKAALFAELALSGISPPMA